MRRELGNKDFSCLRDGDGIGIRRAYDMQGIIILITCT